VSYVPMCFKKKQPINLKSVEKAFHSIEKNCI
jgi:hypothetical protein